MMILKILAFAFAIYFVLQLILFIFKGYERKLYNHGYCRVCLKKHALTKINFIHKNKNCSNEDNYEITCPEKHTRRQELILYKPKEEPTSTRQEVCNICFRD